MIMTKEIDLKIRIVLFYENKTATDPIFSISVSDFMKSTIKFQ